MTTMADDVKRRPYSSERRREQATLTRERVLAAAAALFAERGYDGASIAAVAERAGVSQETVYARFHNKRTLLGELVQAAVRGDDDRPLLEQEGPRAVLAARDRSALCRALASDIASRLERAAPLVAIAAAAARSDPELADLLRRVHAARLRNLRTVVDRLAELGPLRSSAAAAADTLWALTSPELHQLLVLGRGWNRRRYAAWLAATLDAVL